MYGVDLNDLAIEITKVALWLEAFDADRPFPFLDAHFHVGNALLGTTPELLRHNIPDTAFVVLGDDDKDWTKAQGPQQVRTPSRPGSAHAELRPRTPQRRNQPIHQGRPRSRHRQRRVSGRPARPRRRVAPPEADPDLVAAKLVADGWCAAFVQPKAGATTSGQGITHAVRALSETPESVPTPSSPRSMPWRGSTGSSIGTWSSLASSLSLTTAAPTRVLGGPVDSPASWATLPSVNCRGVVAASVAVEQHQENDGLAAVLRDAA